MDIVALELLKALGRLWLHPLTYLFFLAAIWIGLARVKRERKDFHTRVYDVIHELTYPLLISLGFIIVISLIVAGIGIEIPFSMMILLAVIWILFLPFKNARLLSMTMVGSIALIIALFLPQGGTDYPWLNDFLFELSGMNPIGFVWLLVILLLTESLLILTNGWKKTSPMLYKSKRGKTVGAHKVNRLWFLPIFVLIPMGTISLDSWWPLFPSSGSAANGFMFVPFVIGIHAIIKSDYPSYAIKLIGKRLLLLGILAALIAGAATYWTFLFPAVAGFIILGREIVYYSQRSSESKQNSIFSQRQQGLVVLGILPHSTAEKMGIEVGEIITKVNGLEVYTQRDVYEALQKNSAYCKLEVLDYAGEIRFAQSSIFEGDHYQIGLLFVPDDGEGNNLSARGLRSSVVIHQDRNVAKTPDTEKQSVVDGTGDGVIEQGTLWETENHDAPADAELTPHHQGEIDSTGEDDLNDNKTDGMNEADSNVSGARPEFTFDETELIENDTENDTGYDTENDTGYDTENDTGYDTENDTENDTEFETEYDSEIYSQNDYKVYSETDNASSENEDDPDDPELSAREINHEETEFNINGINHDETESSENENDQDDQTGLNANENASDEFEFNANEKGYGRQADKNSDATASRPTVLNDSEATKTGHWDEVKRQESVSSRAPNEETLWDVLDDDESMEDGKDGTDSEDDFFAKLKGFRESASATEEWELDQDQNNANVEEEDDSTKLKNESAYGEQGKLDQMERRPERGDLPYGQAAGLSAFYDEFRKTQPQRNKWRPTLEKDDEGKDKK
ncbi:PDZ domain-containing protein [Evansella tamaricis]|uniref:PDZ domain-containing protein n=1 Tax=Evansella tamaricis TaxID=2069301 RepID=A0ABS6JGL0_9BACI|nr:PDZ domain-containing protein [Evansella tamaricis]MBU9712782.1 hypothetical protein [Evansella tamaricis]